MQKTQNDSTEIWVRKINEEYASINNDSARYRKEKKEVFDQSSEGGNVVKYYDDKTLRKIVLTLFGESGKLMSEYYFMNQEVIFVYDKETIYTSPIYLGKIEVESREENKFYFKNEKLIRWVDNKAKVVDLMLYPEKEKEILDYIKSILE